MKRETFEFELITPCFSGGAEPNATAEIRAASIRGQLRWWFRVLGGFKSLAPQPWQEQEAMIFGATAGDEGNAGLLTVRVDGLKLDSSVKDGQELGHQNFSDPAFLTFPVQSREKNGIKTNYAGRGVITSGRFRLASVWRGSIVVWDDIIALISLWGGLGSLGFRGRRAMGAIAFAAKSPLTLGNALDRMAGSDGVLIKRLPATSAKGAIAELGRWLKACRAHGRTGQNSSEMKSPYFRFAKRDHDIGYELQGTTNLPAYRPAIGLPIIQRTSKQTNQWEWNWNAGKCRAEGRFASPVLLRPHRDSQGSWHALVIFVDAHVWPDGKRAFLNGKARTVSLDLYEAMKCDPNLKPFP